MTPAWTRGTNGLAAPHGTGCAAAAGAGRAMRRRRNMASVRVAGGPRYGVPCPIAREDLSRDDRKRGHAAPG